MSFNQTFDRILPFHGRLLPIVKVILDEMAIVRAWDGFQPQDCAKVSYSSAKKLTLY